MVLTFKPQSCEEGIINLVLKVLQSFRKKNLSANMRTVPYLPQFSVFRFLYRNVKKCLYLSWMPRYFFSWAISKAASAITNEKASFAKLCLKVWHSNYKKILLNAVNICMFWYLWKSYPFSQVIWSYSAQSYSSRVLQLLTFFYIHIHLYVCMKFVFFSYLRADSQKMFSWIYYVD